MLAWLLAPFVTEYWIGRTYIHRPDGTPAGLPEYIPHGISGPHPDSAGLDFRALVSEDLTAMASSSDSDLRSRSTQPGDSRDRFGAWNDGTLVDLCTFAFDEDYLRRNGHYDLRSDEAELTDIFTVAPARGKGTAAMLIRYGTAAMHKLGFQMLYAKVWHSNTPSKRAFVKAGWQQSCFFMRLQPRWTRRVVHIEFRPSRECS